METYSIYIHIPFCIHRCAYCGFNSFAGMNDLIPHYINAIQSEILMMREIAREASPVQTIYFGGGTPSLLPVSSIEEILKIINSCFNITPNPEISFEANPGTLSRIYLEDLVSVGVNRLSLGMQSANTKELVFLDRQHDFNDVIESVKWSRQAGLGNLNLDLIFGLPEQPVENWAETLTSALSLDTEHFSIYALSIENRTPMKTWLHKRLFPPPDPDIAAEMYELASERLSAAGYFQYEISNWTKFNPQIGSTTQSSIMEINESSNAYNWQCRHNLQYWRNLPYYGFGAGAHGYLRSYRMSNIKSPKAYIEHLLLKNIQSEFPETPVTACVYPIDKSTEMSETMMMGLRLTNEGVSRRSFRDRFQMDFYDVFGVQIDKLVEWGLVEWYGDAKNAIRLTSKGRLLGNRVFREFI